MHSPLFSIHFYHTINLPCSTHSSFIQCSFHTIHPSCLWSSLNFTPLNLLFSSKTDSPCVCLCKSPHHTLLCSTTKLSRNTSSPSHCLISHSVYMRYSTHTAPHVHLISITLNLFLSTTAILIVKMIPTCSSEQECETRLTLCPSKPYMCLMLYMNLF